VADKLSDDCFLTSGIRSGSLKAFEQLYHRYKEKLYYFSLKYLNDRDEAEEIVQIVFISLWEHRNTLESSLSVKSYLYKSTVNNIFNFLKKKAIRIRYANEEMLKLEESSNQTYEQMFYNDLEKKIEAIILSLPPQQQKILNLSRFDGLSNDEIASKMELSVRTVENQIYRATKILKEHIKSEIIS